MTKYNKDTARNRHVVKKIPVYETRSSNKGAPIPLDTHKIPTSRHSDKGRITFKSPYGRSYFMTIIPLIYVSCRRGDNFTIWP